MYNEIEPTKKCPYCFTKIKRTETKCVYCHKKIGPPDEHGMAQKPIDWFANIMALGGGGALLYFLYWLFFIENQ